MLLLLDPHLEQHLLLGQVLLLGGWLRDWLPTRRGRLLLRLVLLNFLHEHHLLFLGELLWVLLARPRDFHCVLVAACRHHVASCHLARLRLISLHLVLPGEHLLVPNDLLSVVANPGSRLLALDVNIGGWVALPGG